MSGGRLGVRDGLRVTSVGLRARPLRAGLSALGIAIGTAAIVAILGLSASSQAGLLAEIDRLGTNLLTVEAGQSITGEDASLPLAAPARMTLLDHVQRPAHTALIKHKYATGQDSGLVFGRSIDHPFSPSSVYLRATRAWSAAGLEPIGLHECRHTCASYFIAAGINAKTLSTFLGHASITTTLDRYGHLFPGSEAEAAGLVDAYLARADTSQRLSDLAA